nr:MAG TPA: hypothetical protein [Caudoviricetes sp.]
MSTPDLRTRNNPEISQKLTDAQNMYQRNASAYPGKSAQGDTMTTSEYMDAVDRRNGKSRLFAVQTPGEKIQQAQGPEGRKSLLTGGQL